MKHDGTPVIHLIERTILHIHAYMYALTNTHTSTQAQTNVYAYIHALLHVRTYGSIEHSCSYTWSVLVRVCNIVSAQFVFPFAISLFVTISRFYKPGSGNLAIKEIFPDESCECITWSCTTWCVSSVCRTSFVVISHGSALKVISSSPDGGASMRNPLGCEIAAK